VLRKYWSRGELTRLRDLRRAVARPWRGRAGSIRPSVTRRPARRPGREGSALAGSGGGPSRARLRREPRLGARRAGPPSGIIKSTSSDHSMSSSGSSRVRGSDVPRPEILQGDVRDGCSQYLRATSGLRLAVDSVRATRHGVRRTVARGSSPRKAAAGRSDTGHPRKGKTGHEQSYEARTNCSRYSKISARSPMAPATVARNHVFPKRHIHRPMIDGKRPGARPQSGERGLSGRSAASDGIRTQMTGAPRPQLSTPCEHGLVCV